MALSSDLSQVQDSECIVGDQHNGEQDEQNEQSGIIVEQIIWSFQEPHNSGLGNLTNPHNSCFAAVALQLIVASEADLHLVEGIYIELIVFTVLLLRC